MTAEVKANNDNNNINRNSTFEDSLGAKVGAANNQEETQVITDNNTVKEVNNEDKSVAGIQVGAANNPEGKEANAVKQDGKEETKPLSATDEKLEKDKELVKETTNTNQLSSGDGSVELNINKKD